MTKDTFADTSLSQLNQLAARCAEIQNAQVLDLPVPRWTDPEIHILYRPLELEALTKAQKAVAKAKGDRSEVVLDQNASGLIKACVGIYALIDGERYSLKQGDPNGELTVFDDDLAAALGLDPGRALPLCKKLFITDGDLLSHALQLTEWSGFAATKSDEEFTGE